jgi:hypothetical protein
MHRIFNVLKTLMWYIIIVDWETCDVRITCNWCNQLLNMLGICNLKSRAIFWTQGGNYSKKVENTSIEI